MELEQLELAKRLYGRLCNYKESIQHIDEFPRIAQSGMDLHIEINDGWGLQRIYIPKDVIGEALGLIKSSLENKVKELEQQFKEL